MKRIRCHRCDQFVYIARPKARTFFDRLPGPAFIASPSSYPGVQERAVYVLHRCGIALHALDFRVRSCEGPKL